MLSNSTTLVVFQKKKNIIVYGQYSAHEVQRKTFQDSEENK